MGDHSNRTWCHVLPSVAHILLIFLTHGTQPVSQKKFLTKFYHVQNTTKKISNKKFSQKLLMNGTELVSQKNLTNIFSHMEHNL